MSISTEIERFPIEVNTPRTSIMEEKADLKKLFGCFKVYIAS